MKKDSFYENEGKLYVSYTKENPKTTSLTYLSERI